MQLYKIAKYFTPGTILDIGANIGQFHTLAKNTFPNSAIFSIEASPDCEPHLMKITENYYIGLLAKDTSEYDFYSRKGDMTCTGNSVYRELTQFYSDDQVQILKQQGIRLDDLFEPGAEFDLIKIDTQGSELDIITGGMEVSITQYNEGSPLYEEVLVFMREAGFREELIIDESRNHGSHQQDILFINER